MIKTYEKFINGKNIFKNNESDEIVLELLNDLKKNYNISNFNISYDNNNNEEYYSYNKDGLIIKYERIFDWQTGFLNKTILKINDKIIDISYFTKIKVYSFFKKLLKEKIKTDKEKDFEKIKQDIIDSKSNEYNL